MFPWRVDSLQPAGAPTLDLWAWICTMLAMKQIPSRAQFLFATPGVLEGLARLVDFGNVFDAYNATGPLEDPDRRAIHQDWMAVGDDLRGAMSSHRRGRRG